MHKINLIVGDWSNDGHEKTEDIRFNASLDKENIEKAYKKGIKIVGKEFLTLCEEYEQNTIPKKLFMQICALESRLINYSDFNETIEELNASDESYYSISPLQFAVMYMAIAAQGNVKLTWELDILPISSYINVGGYGLFE